MKSGKDEMEEKKGKIEKCWGYIPTVWGYKGRKREGPVKVGEHVKSKHSAFNGIVERVTEDAYIIASWYNPDTNIRVAHRRVPFGEIAISEMNK